MSEINKVTQSAINIQLRVMPLLKYLTLQIKFKSLNALKKLFETLNVLRRLEYLEFTL